MIPAAAPPERPERPDAWRRWYRRALPAYWVFLFCATHLPRLRLDVPVPWWDKVNHVAAFALLAFLLWRFAETFDPRLSPRFVYLAGGLLVGYAALDEKLQGLVGRSPSVLDWIANTLGIVPTLALLEWRRRRRAPSTLAPRRDYGVQL